MEWSNPGSSDAQIYKDGFHDRLSRYWPEPREQLHSGGWAKTREMVADIKRLMANQPGGFSRVLDLCCGEGATATFLAATEGWELTGIELVESAVMVARARAEHYGTVVRAKLDVAAGNTTAAAASLPATEAVTYSMSYGTAVGLELLPTKDASVEDEHHAVKCILSYKPVVSGKVTVVPPATAAAAPAVQLRLSYQSVADLVRIAHASIHYMPLPSNSYDVVYGQDPDGLANENRIYAFKEVLRVLRPGGLFYFWHHWIPGPGWGRDLLQEYWSDPITGSPRLSYECYLEDLQASGLQLATVTHTTQLAAHHMGAMADRMRREATPTPTHSTTTIATAGDGGGSGGDGSLPDKWLERSLQFAARGGTMGIHVVAFKP